MRWMLIQLIVVYRVTLGQWMGGQCRFDPSCSEYAIQGRPAARRVQGAAGEHSAGSAGATRGVAADTTPCKQASFCTSPF